MHKIMQSCLQIKSCKYQLFQHVTAQGEDVHYKFFCDLCQNMKDKKKKSTQDRPTMNQSSAFEDYLSESKSTASVRKTKSK